MLRNHKLVLMKRFLYIAFILLGVGLLSSCEKNGGSRLSFEGTWDVVKTEMETVQGDRTPCWNEYDKFLFSDSALSIYTEDQVYTLTLNWGAKSFIVEKHTSKELVLIDDASIYHIWDYWYVVTLKKR